MTNSLDRKFDENDTKHKYIKNIDYWTFGLARVVQDRRCFQGTHGVSQNHVQCHQIKLW